VQLNLHNVTGADGLALLRSDEVDLRRGLDAGRTRRPRLRGCISFDPMLIAPPDHPLAAKATSPSKTCRLTA
jgi:DNA-binding transcriptional LysR family regulator